MRWRRPPKTSAVAPSQFAYLDLSPTARMGRSISVFAGDMPCFYDMLELPPWMWPFFTIAGVAATELAAHLLRTTGETLDIPAGAVCVHICVALMVK